MAPGRSSTNIVPAQIVDILAMQVSQDAIQHGKSGNNQDIGFAGQHMQEHVHYQCRQDLMNVLDTRGELQKEHARNKGIQVSHIAIGQGIHDHAHGIAQE
jgi:hypothetical protein